MIKPHRTRVWNKLGIGMVVVAVAIAAGGPAAKKDETRYVAEFDARTYQLGQTGTARVRIGITSWSTDEERNALLATLKEGGTKALTAALEQSADHGWATVGSARQTLRYTRVFEQDGLRRIVVATDRPLGAAEVMRSRRTEDYTLSLIELKLPQTGKGEGTLAIGVELFFDPDENVIEIKNFGSQAARIVNVKERTK